MALISTSKDSTVRTHGSLISSIKVITTLIENIGELSIHSSAHFIHSLQAGLFDQGHLICCFLFIYFTNHVGGMTLSFLVDQIISRASVVIKVHNVISLFR